MAANVETKKTRFSARRDSVGGKDDTTVKELLQQMNKRFDTLATKEDVNDIRGEIKKNAEDIEDVRKEMRANADDIRSKMKTNTESLPKAVQSVIYKVLKSRTVAGGQSEELRQHQNYLLCRRSVQRWPVVNTGGGLKAAARAFMEEILEMEGQSVNRIGIETANPTQQLPRSK